MPNVAKKACASARVLGWARGTEQELWASNFKRCRSRAEHWRPCSALIPAFQCTQWNWLALLVVVVALRALAPALRLPYPILRASSRPAQMVLQ